MNKLKWTHIIHINIYLNKHSKHIHNANASPVEEEKKTRFETFFPLSSARIASVTHIFFLWSFFCYLTHPILIYANGIVLYNYVFMVMGAKHARHLPNSASTAFSHRTENWKECMCLIHSWPNLYVYICVFMTIWCVRVHCTKGRLFEAIKSTPRQKLHAEGGKRSSQHNLFKWLFN